MANNSWLGNSATTGNVAQVDRFTPANVEINDIFTLTATGEDGSTAAVSFTATAATVANVTAGLTAAWNASTNALHTGITAADATTSMTLTADTAGVPFSVAPTTTDGGGSNTQTLTRAAVTASAGNEDFNTASNWATGQVPATSDNWDVDGRAASNIRYGLDQSAKTFGLVRIYTSNTKAIGAHGYKLKAGFTNLVIGEPSQDGGSGGGSSMLNFSLHTVAGTVRVKKTRSSGLAGKPPVQLLPGENTVDVVVDTGCVVGIGTDIVGESATMNDLQTNGGRVEIGSGVSFAGTTPSINFSPKGGNVTLRAAVATVNQDAGTLITEGTGGITTKANIAGTFISNSTGTVADVEVKNAGVLDLTQSTAPRIISNATIVGPAARILANNGEPLSITFTNGVDFIDGADTTQCSMGDEVNAAYTAA